MNKTMQMLPEDERPYEKCMERGQQVLSDKELLAVILRTGVRGHSALELAGDVLTLCKYKEGLSGILHLDIRQLMELPGVGKVKAVQILCIGELSRRIAKQGAYRKLDFNHPGTVADYYMEYLRHEEQEIVICMMLDSRNHLLGEAELSRGTIDRSLLSPREIFLTALSYHAVQLILIHNHPAGDPQPSADDLAITERIRQAGLILGIHLLDHIIIGDRCYTSFLNLGLLGNQDNVGEEFDAGQVP